jgi:cytochrome c-type protein NapB
MPDSLLGLSRASVFAAPAPAPVEGDLGEPGGNPRRPRAWPGQPPQVPHGIRDFLPITRAGNACLDCHTAEDQGEDGPPALPASHFTDLRNRPGEKRAEAAGARYVCVSCHAPPTRAAPIVGNRFGR